MVLQHSEEARQRAELHRMVMDEHVCPYGLKAKALLERKGFDVQDHWLRTDRETEAFKDQHQVETTPQIFIGGRRIGGYDALRRYFGQTVKEPHETSYQPVIALFGVGFLLALAVSYVALGTILTWRVLEWFIGISMCLLGMQKLQDVESFSTMFLNYDLLAKRQVRYAYIYPYAETFAGVLMVAGIALWIAAPVALLIGSIGALSIVKAVYIDRRELKCACVGGGSNVPLGFISLTENLMMMAMAIWMPLRMVLLG